jgi:subtilisin family serine protease
MKAVMHLLIVTRRRFAVWLLITAVCCGGLILPEIQAQSDRERGRESSSGSRRRAQPRRIEIEGDDKISDDLKQRVSQPQNQRERVVLQFKQPLGSAAQQVLSRAGVVVRDNFQNLDSTTVELPTATIRELARLDEVSFVVPDREIRSLGHLSLTTGADAARGFVEGGGTSTGLDGSGIGIAVLDSGIDDEHKSFRDRGNRKRVIRGIDFVSPENEKSERDYYGHGTHVASVAAGNGLIARAAYLGIAPNATLINLRVLDAQGKGSISSVLRALDWVMANRATYNIRVVNLSLGMPAVDSFRNDPICRAVRKLADAGVVVVAAAGNNGRDSEGRKVYGLIHSPGIEPSAITIGASNTFGTDFRGDDVVTTYSSRGPTRSYWTDALGFRHHDNLIKPELVAPGNKVIAAMADIEHNALVSEYPQLNANVSTDPERMMMVMNGTSVATPVVSGTVALMLQANPSLTPNLIKAILMYTAQPLAGYNTLEQGAGQLNIEGAVRLAKIIRRDLNPGLGLGAPLLDLTDLPFPWTTISGYTFPWSQGIIVGHTFLTGYGLMTRYQRIYNQGVLASDGLIYVNGSFLADYAWLSGGIQVSNWIMTSIGAPLGNGLIVTSVGAVFSDGAIFSDGVIAGDGAVFSDTYLQSLRATTDGETTSSMPAVPDDGKDNPNY